ncbi:MAG: PAS domain S-box protein [Candidatus Alcyoniella australis]|nr:PAS domain S-box protein [Candidatus Alcyoniella australis]
MRLRLKLHLVLIAISTVPIVGLTLIILFSLNSLQDRLVSENTSLIRVNLEREIQYKSEDIARQLELYIDSVPEASLSQLQQDPRFRSLAIQSVGATGYTAVHTNDGYSRFHPNRGIEDTQMLGAGDYSQDFLDLFRRSLEGKPVGGYYMWREGSREREKYMACTPVTGTEMILAATVYTDEFLKPAIQAESLIISCWLDMTQQIIVFTAFIVLLVLTIGYSISKLLFRPLEPLLNGMKAFGSGNMSYRIEDRRKDEFSMVSRVFNSMAVRIEAQTSQLAKRTIEAERSERSQRLLFESLYDLVIYVGADGRIVRTSPRSLQVLGYEPHELASRRYDELVDIDSVRWITLPELDQQKDDPAVSEMTLRARHSSGLWVDLQISVVPYHEPDIGEGAMLVCHDLSRELRLEETVQLLSKAVEQSREGIALFDLDGILLYANHTYVEMHGMSRAEEYIGKTLAQIHHDNGNEVVALIKRLLKRPQAFDGEVEHRTENGKSFPAGITVSVVRDEVGQPTALMVTLRDVSERVRLEQELKRHSEDLERIVHSRTEQLAEANHRLEKAMQQVLELDRLKGDFVAHVSHQLRTPLNTIIGFSSMLLADQSLERRVHEDLKHIYHDAQRLSRFIDSILLMADIEAGQVRLEPTRFDLAESVRTVIEAVTAEAEAKGLSIVDLVSGRDIEIFADRRKLDLVLHNLLLNAVQYTSSGEIVVGVRTLENMITLSVRDTGPGITADELDQLFERFSKSSHGGGMGLGLPMAQAFIRMHGGEISVESKLGEGSTIYVRLPAQPKDE